VIYEDCWERQFGEAIQFLGPRHFSLVGRGASALCVALNAIKAREKRTGEVIIPDMICSAVLEAVLAAGFTPRLADVQPDTYTISPDTVAPLLNSSTRVIIVAHLFGHAAPVAALQTLALQHKVYVIEDAVQGIGGRSAETGASLGAHGDFAFVSFHTSKMIRGQGALLLFDDEVWWPYVNSALEMIPATGVAHTEKLLHTALRDLYHGIGQSARAGRAPPDVTARAFRELLPVYAPLLWRAFDWSPINQKAILKDLNSLPNRVQQRNEKAALLRETLNDFPIEQPPYRPGYAIGRYSIRLPTVVAADEFVATLR